MEQLDHSHLQFGVCDKWLALQMFVDFNTHLFIFFQQIFTEHPLGILWGTGNPTGNKTDKVHWANGANIPGSVWEWGEQGRQKSKQINKDDERL